MNEVRPVFIVGSVRSGTTILAKSLESAGYRGFDEGHLFHIAAQIMGVIDTENEEYIRRHSRTDWSIAHFPIYELKHEISQFFTDFQRNRLGERWYDKTPGPVQIKALPDILKILPNARVIFCKRRGVDVIMSAIRRFGLNDGAVEQYCDHWVEVMQSWSSIAAGLKQNAMTVDHNDISQNPERTAAIIGKFLDLPPANIEEIGATLENYFPERTSTSFNFVKLSDTDLSDSSKDYIKRKMQYPMRINGYDLESEQSNAISSRTIEFSRDENDIDIIDIQDDSFYKFVGGGAFLLHPPRNGKTSVGFKNISTNQSHYVRITSSLRHKQSADVKISAKMIFDNDRVTSRSVICNPHEMAIIDIPLDGEYHSAKLVISTSMANSEDTNAYAWLNIERIEIG